MPVQFGQLLPQQLLFMSSPQTQQAVTAAQLPPLGHGIIDSPGETDAYTVTGRISTQNPNLFRASFKRHGSGALVTITGDPVHSPDYLRISMAYLAPDGGVIDMVPGRDSKFYKAFKREYQDDPALLEILDDAVTLFTRMRSADRKDYNTGFLARA